MAAFSEPSSGHRGPGQTPPGSGHPRAGRALDYPPVVFGCCVTGPGPEIVAVLLKPQDVRRYWVGYTATAAILAVILVAELALLPIAVADRLHTHDAVAAATAAAVNQRR